MSTFEQEETERLAAAAADFAPGTTPEERAHDVAALRSIVRKYGRFVGWAASQILTEPEREREREAAAVADAEISRRLACGEPLTAGQICRYIGDTKAEQSRERAGWWLDHVLDRATGTHGLGRSELLRVAVLLLGRYLRPDPGQPLDDRWSRIADLNAEADRGISRELRRQGVVSRQS